MAEFASKGVAGSGLGLGIAGTALGLLNGGLGGIFGGWGACRDGVPISRYDSELQAEVAALKTEVKLRDANSYTMSALNDFRNYVDGKFAVIHEELAQQRVYNATNNATQNCLAGQVAQLMSLTKVVIPNSSICPGYGDVTVTVTPATTGA